MRTVLLAAALVLAQPPATGDAKKELEKFQGTWTVVSMENGGQKVPEEQSSQIRLTYKDNTYSVMLGGETRTGTFQIDPSKKPKAIDRTPTSGPNKGKTFKGIYEFDGETLRCCWSVESDRPTEFVSKAQPLTILEVLKKAK